MASYPSSTGVMGRLTGPFDGEAEGAGLALIDLSVDASSSKATQTSSTRPPAQTANCSGVATNRWWHASEQK
jgi:hypothetical protein